ncbi:hypothetical protein MUP77_26040, partial [Candidatus Bathyarchaeota archaeon]|nr:hypothetical protein [Candidatus Bathyarchaeota archaeon]
AGEVVGPTECFGIIEGTVFCLACGPDGEVSPMEDVTIKVLSDGNEVASLWSTTKNVRIYDASRRSKANPSAATKAEKTGQGKKTCPCSKKS